MRTFFREVGDWVRTFGSAAVYATLIVTFVGQVARVDGFSMQPTLEDNDRLIVNKLAYQLHAPAPGDVVMLLNPEEPSTALVKRVIAGPDDVVRSVDGRVLVNDVPLPDSFISPEFRSHDSWGPDVVPEGYYWVMGDHRNNSADSRVFSYVPRKYILGKVQIRWWPIGAARVFYSETHLTCRGITRRPRSQRRQPTTASQVGFGIRRGNERFAGERELGARHFTDVCFT